MESGSSRLECGSLRAHSAASLALAFAVATAGPAGAQSAAIDRVSVDSNGAQCALESRHVSISGDGRYVAFDSASALVPGKTASSFVYVRDRLARTTELASVSVGGGNPAHFHASPSISDDGRWVAFVSNAGDLGPPDTNGLADVYLYDRVSGGAELVSISTAGAQSNGPCFYPSVSGDGRFVVFVSSGDNLVPGDVGNMADVFLRDRASGVTERVSVSSSGAGGNGQSGSLGNRVEQAVSDDGRFVAFVSWASNLVPGDTNAGSDVFLRDRRAGVTLCVSAAAGGIPGDAYSWAPRLSPDGRFIAFTSRASNLVPGDTNGVADVFLQDRVLGTLTRSSVDPSGAQLSGQSAECAVSADGRSVAFTSLDAGLAPGASGQSAHLFVRDHRLGTTRIASLSADGAFENGLSYASEISADGSTLAFLSTSSNLVALDTNQVTDAFAHDLLLTPPLIYCTGKLHSEGCTAAISASGVPSASSGQPFLVRARGVLSATSGLLLYAPDWQQVPFQGGVLCLAGPTAQTQLQPSGGSVPCGGNLAIDFNAYMLSGLDPSLGPGATVTTQWWFRDPGDPHHSGLSNALLFFVQP